MRDDLSQNYAQAFGGALIAGEKCALIIVDVVVAYLREDSALYASAAKGALEVNLRLARQARESNIPVVLTNVEYSQDGIDGGQFFRKVPSLKAFIKGSPLGAFPDGLAEPSDIVVTKQYASAFFGTSLASTLRSLGVDTVLITGFSTSGCVRATALDALQSGFVPFVVEPACADRHADPHRANLFDLQAKYAEVVDEAFAISLLARNRA
jgi:maleamate amidohydrolase